MEKVKTLKELYEEHREFNSKEQLDALYQAFENYRTDNSNENIVKCFEQLQTTKFIIPTEASNYKVEGDNLRCQPLFLQKITDDNKIISCVPAFFDIDSLFKIYENEHEKVQVIIFDLGMLVHTFHNLDEFPADATVNGVKTTFKHTGIVLDPTRLNFVIHAQLLKDLNNNMEASEKAPQASLEKVD